MYSSQGTASTTTLTSHSSSHGMYNVVHVHYKMIWPDIFKLFCPYLICEIDYFALFIVFFWNQLLTMGVRQLEWLGNSVKMMHCWKWTPRFQAHKERPWILTVVNLDVVSLERITNDCLVARRHWFSVFSPGRGGRGRGRGFKSSFSSGSHWSHIIQVKKWLLVEWLNMCQWQDSLLFEK